MASGSTSPEDSLDELQDAYERIEQDVAKMDGILRQLEERTAEHEDADTRPAGGKAEGDPPIILQLRGDETDSEAMEELQRAHRAMRREHLALRDLVMEDFMGSLRDVAGAVRRLGKSVKALTQRVQGHEEAMAARNDTINALQEQVEEQRTWLNQVEERVTHMEARADFIADELD